MKSACNYVPPIGIVSQIWATHAPTQGLYLERSLLGLQKHSPGFRRVF